MRNNIKTIVSLLFIIMVLCYVAVVLSIEYDFFSTDVGTPEKTTMDTEMYVNTKDSIGFQLSDIW